MYRNEREASGDNFKASKANYQPSTIQSLATCKNGISVGASLNDREAFQSRVSGTGSAVAAAYTKDSVAYFSAVGPTNDKRFKPDIVAPGEIIMF